ncbi:hypothetical protein D9758_017487 [Tetrapyrgos nigripes]|uniref:WD40 repeat-like protein n=1 Tax=Tetrapyrgos nigripes TaxID=182062 RepID=A0A8H5C358_9AGAR|nr:hypothetical protein D9758_017487 [Tetrapyrgos nigripes]
MGKKRFGLGKGKTPGKERKETEAEQQPQAGDTETVGSREISIFKSIERFMSRSGRNSPTISPSTVPSEKNLSTPAEQGVERIVREQPSTKGLATQSSQQIFSNASDFEIRNAEVNNIGGDQINIVNNYAIGEVALTKLKGELQPVLNPVQKTDECLEGTRVQLLKDLCNWVVKPESKLAWVFGIAGTGKSAIAVSLAQRFRAMNDDLKLALTFHCVKGQETSKVSSLVPTICYHLAKVFPEYRVKLAQKFEVDASLNSIGLPLQQQIETLLDRTLFYSQSTLKVVIIIDGLDEWGSSNEWKILSESLIALCFQFNWFRVVITSRPQTEVDKAINASVAVETFDLMKRYHADEDIHLVLTEGLKKPATWSIVGSHIEKLVEKANGLFIWAKTVQTFITGGMDEIGRLQLILGLPGEDVEEGNPYKELYILYAGILQESFQSPKDQSHFRNVMAVLFAVMEPVSPTVLSKLMGSNSPWVVEKILHVMKALVYERDGKLYYHLSFKEFVTSSLASDGFSCQLPICHQFVLNNCMSILKKELKFNICDLESSDVKNASVKNPPLQDRIQEKVGAHLQYSCMHWATHLDRAGNRADEILDSVGDFMNGKWLIFWLECMSLLGRMYNLKENLSSIALWAKSIEDTKIEDLAVKAARLMNAFTLPLNESTPHLYVSALSMVSQLNWFDIVRKHLKKGVQIENFDLSSQLLTINAKSEVTSVACSPNGRNVVSGSSDQTVRIWDTETGKQVGEPLQGHTDYVLSVAYSPDGKHVVSGSSDQTVRIWDTETGKQVGEPLQGHTDYVWSVAYSPDGKHVVSGSSDQTVRIWDTETGKQVGEPLQGHTHYVRSVAYSPDGKHVVSGSDDQTVRIWDTETGKQVGEPLQGHTHYVWSVAYSPDGKHVVSGSSDQTVRIWDTETGKQVGEPLQGHTHYVWSVAYSPDGKHVVSGSSDQTVRIWDTETGKQVGEPLQGHTDSVWSVAYSPDGKHVVSGSSDQTVRIWDTETGKQVGEPLQGHTDYVRSVAYSPDGRHVVSGSSDQTVRIWDTETGKQVGEPLQGHTDYVWSVAYSPDGKHVVSGSSDQTVRIWDIETGKQVGEPLQGHTGYVQSVAYSPDGKHVVSGSSERTVGMWNTQVLHDQAFTSYAHSPPNEPCNIDSQGWLHTLQSDSKLILWLPPNVRGGFADSRQVLTIPSNANDFAVKVDWSNFVYGENWIQMWKDKD